MCKVKHFFPLSSHMELRLFDTFGMLLYIHGDSKQQLKVWVYNFPYTNSWFHKANVLAMKSMKIG